MIEIIPAIDIIDGKCVRLSQGDYAQKKIYYNDPLDTAMMFEDSGIHRLHLVDLDGAKTSHIVNWKTLERISQKTRLIIDFGGGLKTDDDVRIAFQSGAAMITGGSIAVMDPDMLLHWLKIFGKEKIILGADVRNEKIAISGWLEETEQALFPFLKKYIEQGINKVICTDISKDGMLEGTSVDLYKKIITAFPELYLIASGGVSSIKDIEILEECGIPAVIVGKAIYEGNIKLDELKKFIVH